MTVLSSGWSRTRRPRRCGLCDRTIAVGERYHHQFQVDYGDAWTWQTCEHCHVYASLIFQSDQWDEDFGLNSDTADEFEPRTSAEASLKAMYLARWRRPDGELTPVPRLVYARVFRPRRAPWEPRFDRVVMACVVDEPTGRASA